MVPRRLRGIAIFGITSFTILNFASSFSFSRHPGKSSVKSISILKRVLTQGFNLIIKLARMNIM